MVAPKVFIARHGERIDHVDPGWKGRVAVADDPFLTERGVAQADCLGRRLAHENIAKIFVSPFYRTLQTAAAAAKHIGAPIHVEPGMCEALLPEWFGAQPRLKAMDTVSAEFKAVVADYSPVHVSVWPESKHTCRERVFKTARALAQAESTNILLVGHGITCDYATQCLLSVNHVDGIDYCGLIECVLNQSTSDDISYSYGAHKGPTSEYIDADVRPRGLIRF